MAEQVHFLTAEGRTKLEQELANLTNVRRIEIAESLKAAVEEGDITENSGYDEAKREQAFIEGRIQELEAILHNARLLTGTVRAEVIGIGVTFTVTEGSGEPETYQIVGRTEADPIKGRISNESPLGKALLGKRTGELVRVDTPGGTVHFKVVAIQ